MKGPRLFLAGAAAIVAAMLGVCLAGASPKEPPKTTTGSSGPIADFLARHWADPILPQGEPPAAFSNLEASLEPASCGKCHAQQFLDWKSSLHSETMGPGIRWQLLVMDQKGANGCLRCHAPLAEQKALLAIEQHWKDAPAAPPPAYVGPNLHRQGLVCAACHVRRHVRFGPPRRSEVAQARDSLGPHGGFTPSAGFEDSRFCAACHQFSAGGAQLNGKFLENTYEEWRASPAAREGRTCQSCHMPGRRHLWRGIHDVDMVRQALHVSLEVRPHGRNALWAQAELTNAGAGHYFPTYVVPEVVAVLQLVDTGGKIRSEIARRIIGRSANLELTKEISDTRIAAGGRMQFGGLFPYPGEKGWQVELRVMVHPGKHYERLFRSVLERPRQPPPQAVLLLREALARIEGGEFELYRIRRPLPSR